MNSKTKTYLLLILVISVWSVIGFKIWQGLNKGNSLSLVENKSDVFRPKATIAIDTFSIKEVSRDPFLGTIKKNTVVTKTRSVKQRVQWMPIVFKGIIKNSKTRQQVYVVQINNTEHLLKKGNVVDSVTLLRGNSKAIILSYKGQQKTIKYQE